MKRKAKVKVVKYIVGKPAAVEEIDNNLEALQKFCGGYIETWGFVGKPGFMLVCYEYGRYERESNRFVPGLGDIFGDFLIVKVNDEGENVSMTAVEAKDVMKRIPQ